jgi:hypothetical protein
MLSSHRFEGRLLSRGAPGLRAGRRRGVTLVATVLLSLMAATIGLVVVRQTVLSTRTDTLRSDLDAAYAASVEGRADFERSLAADPRFYLSRVSAAERARVCAFPGGSVTVQPPADATQSVAWPPAGHPECADRWTYATADHAGVVREEITPPSPSDVNLHVRLLAAVGNAETGVSADYRMDTAGKFTAYSAGDLHLDDLASGAATTLEGALYTGGQMFLPTTADVSLTEGTQLFAEDGFVGSPDGSVRAYTGGDAENGLRPIRATLADPQSLEGLRSTARRLQAVGCPGGAPVNFTSGNQYASSLCLAAGAQVMPAAGTGGGSLLTVPKSAAYLLIFGGPTAPDTVDVYAASSAPNATGDCAITCDLPALAAGDVAAGTHPGGGVGARTVWGAKLGTFRLPTTGVITADADVYLSQCTTFTTAGGTCPSLNGSPEPGMQVGRSVTVVAGSADAPHDVYLSGPVTAAGNARLGVVATGSVVVPYWSRPAGGSLRVDAALVALGLDHDGTTAALRSLPAELPPAGGPADPSYAQSLVIRGSVAAPDLDLTSLAGFRAVALQADPELRVDPPPYLPGFTDTWSRYGAARLSSPAVCGQLRCVGSW